MNNRGSALIIVYSVILVLIALGVAIIQQSLSERTQVGIYKNSLRCFWVAEEGVQYGFWQLNYGSGAGTYQGTETGIGDYDVTITDIGSEQYRITGVGTVPDRNSPVRTRSISIVVKKVYIAIFRYAAFGKDSVSLTNSSTTNSYDSDVGAYGGANILHGGDVGTNGTTIGAISLSNSSQIDGDANTGPSGTVTLANSSTVTGTTSQTSNESFPPIVVPAALTGLSSSGALSLSSSQTRNLSGDYNYTSVSLANSAIVTITGDTRIYVTSITTALSLKNSSRINVNSGVSLTFYVQGRTSIANSATINNLAQKPEKFILYSSYSGLNGVSFSNSGSLYGAIYAPNTPVSLANSFSIYGSAIGKTITMPNSSKIHYDEALGRSTTAAVTTGEYSFKSWVEN